MVVVNVDEYDQFQKEILDSKEQFIVVDFYTLWCGPCKKFAPDFDLLSEQFKDKVKFIKVNIEKVEECVDEYDVEKLPTIMFFDKGNLQSHYNKIISVDKTVLENKLNELCEHTPIIDDF